MTGIFFRIERSGKWQSVELEDMTADEIKAVAADLGPCQLIDVICLMVETVREANDA